MSIERRPDESWEQFKARQKEENKATKYSRQHGRLLVDSHKALGITQRGVDAAKMRKAKYDLQRAANANLSKTQKRKKGLIK